MGEHEEFGMPCSEIGGCGGGCDGCQAHEPPDPWAEDFETYGNVEEEE